MAVIWKDRVLETSTTTGTGSFTLAGAVTGYRAFSSVCSTNDTFYYYIEGVDGSGIPTGEWETGYGTYSGANTLARTTVHASSNSGSAVNFSAGTKRCSIGATATSEHPFTPPTTTLLSTALNSPTVTDGTSSMRIEGAVDSSLIRGRLRSLPGGDFTVTAHLAGYNLIAPNNGVGIIFRDTGGKYATVHIVYDSSTVIKAGTENWSDHTTWSSVTASVSFGPLDAFPLWLRGVFTSSTNDFVAQYSHDGIDWVTIGTNTYLATCDAVGLALLVSNVSNAPQAWFDHWSVV